MQNCKVCGKETAKIGGIGPKCYLKTINKEVEGIKPQENIEYRKAETFFEKFDDARFDVEIPGYQIVFNDLVLDPESEILSISNLRNRGNIFKSKVNPEMINKFIIESDYTPDFFRNFIKESGMKPLTYIPYLAYSDLYEGKEEDMTEMNLNIDDLGSFAYLDKTGEKGVIISLIKDKDINKVVCNRMYMLRKTKTGGFYGNEIIKRGVGGVYEPTEVCGEGNVSVDIGSHEFYQEFVRHATIDEWIIENDSYNKNPVYALILKGCDKQPSRQIISNYTIECIKNGFYNKDPEYPETTLYTIGSLYEASKHAISNKEICFSPTSGFHHAEYSKAQDFCTFNGLILVANQITKEFDNKVCIIDLDYHFPNGSLDILKKISNERIEHYYIDNTFKSSEYLRELESIMRYVRENYSKEDLVMVQLAADTYIGDPLGGSLSKDELNRRDIIIKEFFEEKNIPLCWNLGGGYCEDFEETLSIHLSTYSTLSKKV